MYIALNIIGLVVFIFVAYLFSINRKAIAWSKIGIVLALEIFLAWFFTSFSVGRDALKAAADGFTWLVNIAYQGIVFALPNWVSKDFGGTADSMNFVASALLPILMVIPLFDILTYIGVLPWLVKWIGRGLSFITGQPKFEAFFSVEMMFLGNTDVLAISKPQLTNMSKERNLTLALMSMSCVTASILGAYTSMMPGQYILTAVPLNILGAIAIAAILNPLKVDPKDDVIYGVQTVAAEEAPATKKGSKTVAAKPQKEPFFSFLGDSILGAGRLILIIAASVIAFVALAALIDALFALTGLKWLSLENIFGVIMFPFAMLLGFNTDQAFKIARYMGTKLVTNEFVVMGQVTNLIKGEKGMFSNPHAVAVLTVFLTSFANFSTVGMIIGAFKGLVSKEKNDYISKQVPRMLLAGILVSLLSAGAAGLFVW